MNHYIEATEKFVTTLFHNYCDETFQFHNISHTKKVVQRTIEISKHEDIDPHDTSILIIAAWFHDTGYFFTEPSLHEAKSVDITRDFFSDLYVSPVDLAEITSCITATKFPTHPSNKLQAILCDADTFHFGTPEFIESNEKVYLELSLRHEGIPKDLFIKKTIAMMRAHSFYTNYCRNFLNTGKEENIISLTE